MRKRRARRLVMVFVAILLVWGGYTVFVLLDSVPPPEHVAVEIPTSATGPNLGDTHLRADGMTQLFVPAGSFEMGSDVGEGDEKPVHTVTLSAYWIDQTEVTNAQYAQCTDSGCAPSTYLLDDDFNGDDQPVIGVDWYSADRYCHTMGGQLPTEAQWEYAARGPSGWDYPWGDEFDGEKLNYFNENLGRTVAVGSYPAGASWVGALDMAGNAWEWTNDWYDSRSYTLTANQNPVGPDTGIVKVVRGGTWYSYKIIVRTSRRFVFAPAAQAVTVGFRCVSDQ